MKLYADASVRRTLQIAGDLLAVLWIWLWIASALKVHDATLELATPGSQDRRERLRPGRAPARRREDRRRRPAGR